MCGIAGILTKDIDKRSVIYVRRMLDLLIHRGPDDSGLFEDNQVCLGHRRLSIIDLSQAGHQPMVDKEKSVLVFNGEIYNHHDLRQILIKEGYLFKGRSDTEVLLYGYNFWGDEIVNKIKGFFAFAIWDFENQRLFCACDPFGKKPFYYHWNENRFVFASDVEALIAGLDTRPDINYADLSHYLLKGYFSPGTSVYESIQTLKAGHCLSVDMRNTKLKQWQYRELLFRQNSIGHTDDIIKSCGELIDNAIQKRLESDVPIGVLLSGGIDSSLIALSAAKQSQRQVRTFTATFKETKFDEGNYAMKVVKKAQTNHLEVDMDMEVFPNIVSNLVKAYSEPFGDYSAIPTFLLFQAIKPYVKVALTGDGGDEVFAGYKDTKLFLFREILAPLMTFIPRLAKEFPTKMIYNKYRNLREIGYALIALRSNGSEAFYSLEKEGWTRIWRQRLMRPEAWKITEGDSVDYDVKQKFIKSGRNDMERYLNLRIERLTQDFLVKIDRASMAHSIEVRCPMLDVDMFTFVSNLPYQSLLKNGETKSILKNLLSSQMGSSFARRKKKGFTPPLSEWFREKKYQQYLNKKLTNKDSLVFSLFKPESINWMLNQHFKGQDHTERIWILLFLNEWYDHFCNGIREIY